VFLSAEVTLTGIGERYTISQTKQSWCNDLICIPEESFWHWFLAHEEELLNWERERERVFDLSID
jgi:hypothetical protein